MTTSNSIRPQKLYETYPHWDTVSILPSTHSRLYNLAPVGPGTIKVESLTGYIARLAEAHCVSPHMLLNKEVLISKKRPKGLYDTGFFRFASNQINGVGRASTETTVALEKLTLRQDIRYTTMWTWKDILSPQQLLRKKRAWCSTCYGERFGQGEPIYEFLLWAFEIVSMCPWHHQTLSEICPHCSQHLPPLASAARPGYCSRCRGWLGILTDTSMSNQSNKAVSPTAEFEQQISIIDFIGELLSEAPNIIDSPT
jgi:hypothetical protein